jgi:hypothetical protein
MLTLRLADYLSENFGIPFATAIQITQEAAQKLEKAKNKKKKRK